MSEKPTAAFALSLVGGVLILLTGLLVMAVGGAVASWLRGLGGLVFLMGLLGLAFGAIVVAGAAMIYSGESERVRAGSILVLVFSVLSLFVVGGGFLVGFILGLVGGVLGLTWRPPERVQQAPPQT